MEEAKVSNNPPSGTGLQVGLDLRGALRQLVDVQVQDDVALEAEQAAGALLEDGGLLGRARRAEQQHNVFVQKPVRGVTSSLQIRAQETTFQHEIVNSHTVKK